MKKIHHVAIVVALAASAYARLPQYVVSGFLTAEALAEAVSPTVIAAQTGNDLFQQALSKERAERQRGRTR